MVIKRFRMRPPLSSTFLNISWNSGDAESLLNGLIRFIFPPSVFMPCILDLSVRSSDSRALATVHGQHRGGNEFGLVRSEKKDRVRGVPAGAHSSFQGDLTAP